MIAERVHFQNRNQAKHESIAEYTAKLRKPAQFCEFGAGLYGADILVCGMHCESTQKRLLSEKDLTLDKAVAITVSMETAAKDFLELQKKAVDSGIHTTSLNNAKRQAQKCYSYGKTSHDANGCRLWDKNCRRYNKPGHRVDVQIQL